MAEALKPLEMPDPSEPRTAFDWALYSTATFAGLSPLTPVPVLDWLLEGYFRSRLPQAVARSRGQKLPPQIAATLNRSTESCLTGCWLWPIQAIFQLLKSISKKVFYVLSIAEATDKLSLYWHQAFLIDAMLAYGHLEDAYTAQLARYAMDRVLRNTTTNPFVRLASQLSHSARHNLRSLLRARRGEEDDAMYQQKARLIQSWGEYAGYLRELAARYQAAFREAQSNPPFPRSRQ